MTDETVERESELVSKTDRLPHSAESGSPASLLAAARAEDLALQRYGHVLQYLAVEFQMELSKNNLFMAANIALLAVEAAEFPKLGPFASDFGPYFICVVGLAITFLWLFDLKQASCFCYQWESTCIELEPQAFGSHIIWRRNREHSSWIRYHKLRLERKEQEEAWKKDPRTRPRRSRRDRWCVDPCKTFIDFFRGHLPGGRKIAALMFLGLWSIAAVSITLFVVYRRSVSP